MQLHHQLSTALLLALLLSVGQQGGVNGCGSGGGRSSSSSSSRGEDAEVSGGGGSGGGDLGPAEDGGNKVRVSGRIRLNPAPASLPADARLVVSLQDTSLADAPSKLLARKTVNSVSAAYNADGSIPYVIDANIPTSTPMNSYSVSISASLRGDGVSYLTDTMYNVNLSPGTFEYNSMDFTIVKYP